MVDILLGLIHGEAHLVADDLALATTVFEFQVVFDGCDLASAQEVAAGARRWNDANVLAIGLRLTSAAVAREMFAAFFSTDADPGEAAHIAQLS